MSDKKFQLIQNEGRLYTMPLPLNFVRVSCEWQKAQLIQNEGRFFNLTHSILDTLLDLDHIVRFGQNGLNSFCVCR